MLNTNHTGRSAIEPTVICTNTLKIVNTMGITKAMRSTPKTGAEHTDLHAVGKSDSMLEFVSAVPNGSVDGR